MRFFRKKSISLHPIFPRRPYRSDKQLNRQYTLHRTSFYMIPIFSVSADSAESTVNVWKIVNPGVYLTLLLKVRIFLTPLPKKIPNHPHLAPLKLRMCRWKGEIICLKEAKNIYFRLNIIHWGFSDCEFDSKAKKYLQFSDTKFCIGYRRLTLVPRVVTFFSKT